MNNLAFACAGIVMISMNMKQFLFISLLDVRIMVFASGALSLNAFAFFVFFIGFLSKMVWMDATLNPFFCAANTYFGIYGAVVLWTNPLFQVYLGTKKFNELENFTESPNQQRIRMNLTMEAVKYFDTQADPYRSDYDDISVNLGVWLDKIWGPLTMLVVWALISAGFCVLAVLGYATYFVCCKKKEDTNAISHGDENADD